MMFGEIEFSLGSGYSKNAVDAIRHMRAAALYEPFDWRIRGASGRIAGEIALRTDNKGWKEAARIELKAALEKDYTAADLLHRLITIDLQLGHNVEAQHYYDQFKRVAKASPLIKLVETHQQASAAVAGDP